MKKQTLKVVFAALALCLLSSLPGQASALRIEDLTNVEVEGDFTIGPGKTEVFLDPGEETIREIKITNRTGRAVDFRITTEDFRGTATGETPLQLLGTERGPYSLVDYLDPETQEFTLGHGQRMILPVKISIPEDAEPGGRYGAVLVSALPPPLEGEEAEERAKGQVRVIGRIGSLFFVRVKGDVEEEGSLTGFKTADNSQVYVKGPIDFELFYENTGSVHLNPYGKIEIKNVFGRKVGEMELDPWFTLPGSLRIRKVTFNREWMLGRYTATAQINRGYSDIIDEKEVVFWMIPWQILVPALLSIILLVVFFKWFFGKFEIRAKRRV